MTVTVRKTLIKTFPPTASLLVTARKAAPNVYAELWSALVDLNSKIQKYFVTSRFKTMMKSYLWVKFIVKVHIRTKHFLGGYKLLG